MSRLLTSPLDAALIAACLLLLLLAYVAGALPVSLGVVGCLIAISAISPVAAICATAASIGFVSQSIPFGTARFSLPEVMVVTSASGVGVHAGLQHLRTSGRLITTQLRALSRMYARGFAPVGLAVLLIGTISLATVARPEFRPESLREFRWVILEPVVFFMLARWYLRSSAQRLLAATLFLLGAFVVSLTGLADLLTSSGLAVEGVVRISGVYPHPNALALFLERAFVLAAGIATLFRRDAGLGWLLIGTVVGSALVLTFSRGALLAAGVALVTALVVGQRKRLAAAAATIGLLLLVSLLFVASDRFGNLFSGGSGTLRLSLWESSIKMIRDYPISGVGLDQFLYVYAPRYILPEAWPERFTSHPHNILLDLWLRLGIMGLAAALFYAVVFVRRVRRIVSARNSLGLAASAAVVVGALHGLVDNGYFLPDLALSFWFFSALVDSEAAADSIAAGSMK